MYKMLHKKKTIDASFTEHQEIQDLISQVAVLQFEDTMHGYTACAHLERDAQLLRFNIYRSAMASIKTEPLFHG